MTSSWRSLNCDLSFLFLTPTQTTNAESDDECPANESKGEFDAPDMPAPGSNPVTEPLAPVRPGLSGHLYLIEGAYEDIKRYAGTTVDWGIWVADLLCDPLGAVQLYTHTTGSASDWLNLDRTSRPAGDKWSMAISYFLESINSSRPPPILLSRISEREVPSVISWGPRSSFQSFRKHIVCVTGLDMW
ncbi:hypothetical protein M413DRAFT_434417 [Hebeloma cylindrosporum]|uniref:Uncharacterized protein n=1 Tax=Hebeloma cylindrosporum TaxID=76867 RepID=A0A0C3CIX0_HEBCY|nr:hypothetical protein M413DRAFT_434417 [Hebeloma cylindrosporum h7]